MDRRTINEMYEKAKKMPGTFMEFPVMTENGIQRLTVINPKVTNEQKDVMVRIFNGDALADYMLHNRAVFQAAYDKVNEPSFIDRIKRMSYIIQRCKMK